MITMDINLKLFFDDVSVKSGDDAKRATENAIKELFDDIFGTTEEYIKTEVKIQDIKEVDE